MVAVGAFGGAARKIRQTIARADSDATSAHVHAMGRAWHEGAAAELISALIEQRDRRAAVEARQRNLEQQAAKGKKLALGVGVAFLLLAVASRGTPKCRYML